jgi:hypothetical protein
MPSLQSEALRNLVKSQLAPLFAAQTPLAKQRVIWESLSAISDWPLLLALGKLLKYSPAFGTLLSFLAARPTLAKLQAAWAARTRPDRQIEYINTEHVWQIFVAQLPEAQQALASLASFITQNTSSIVKAGC